MDVWVDEQPAYYRDFKRAQQFIGVQPNFPFKREKLTRLYSHAVPTREALEMIAGYSPIVEVGAGTGYWARLLQDLGADVEAYDSYSDMEQWWVGEHRWTHVEQHDGIPKGVHDRALLLVWPPPELFTQFVTEYKGDVLLVVEETGTAPTIIEELGGWELQTFLRLPRWPACYDTLYVWERV